jgi:hypothetical protein
MLPLNGPQDPHSCLLGSPQPLSHVLWSLHPDRLPQVPLPRLTFCSVLLTGLLPRFPCCAVTKDPCPACYLRPQKGRHHGGFEYFKSRGLQSLSKVASPEFLFAFFLHQSAVPCFPLVAKSENCKFLLADKPVLRGFLFRS